MKVSAVKLFDGGFMMKSFACGGGLPCIHKQSLYFIGRIC